mgnify:CR=1 FL=1|tara:strand:- start:216 stop:941 length:726 start_codon:yes stop_codon:yes gene_type:complete
MNIVKNEPTEAFPYLPPSDDIRKKYSNIFDMEEPLKIGLPKLIFDKTLSLFFLVLSSPIMLVIKFAYFIEGLIIKENSGPVFFYYWAISSGKKIKKWKIRLIKEKYIDKEKAKNHEWLAYAAEWNSDSRTYVGAFVKKWYLDELPQFWSIFKGDMSFVGPRPLSELHYKRDLNQGNVSRRLIRGGLLGLGHINKGTEEMGNPLYEYEYIDQCLKRNSLSILLLDIYVIFEGLKLVLKGGGY